MMEKVEKQNTVLVNCCHALFSLSSAHDDLVMQALVWFHKVMLRMIQSGVVQFGVSYANLRQSHTFRHQI